MTGKSEVRQIPLTALVMNEPSPFLEEEVNVLEGVLGPRSSYPPVLVRWDESRQAYLVVGRQESYALAARRGEPIIPCIQVW